MIKGFACKRTEALFRDGTCHKQFRPFRQQAERKLQMLHSAERVNDLLMPPGNQLEKLTGNLEGRWSIRINRQFRLVFEWDDESACARNVYIDDYH